MPGALRQTRGRWLVTVPTRQRLIDAASVLFRRQGLSGTGVKQILAAADAPFSSLYHHFPGGKDELAAVAIAAAGDHYEALVTGVWDAQADLAGSVAAVFDGAAEILVLTGYADACPIATVALEVASTNETLRAATARVFGRWDDAVTRRLAAGGADGAGARALAQSILALLEGAFILARAAKSTEPMRAARDSAVTLVQAALRDAAGDPGGPGGEG
jgi:AcrR family transcriptional regulator